MKDFFDVARHLVWMTQFGLSVVLPPLLCLLGAGWLRERFALGGWVMLVGLALGVLGALGGLSGSLRALRRQGAEKRPPDEKPPVSFDRH